MQVLEPITEGKFYYIFHRGINGECIFRHPKNYAYFLRKYHDYTRNIADTIAYCLLKNQFNLLIYVRGFNSSDTLNKSGKATRKFSAQFGHFLNAYAQAYNKMYNRYGGLFVKPFRRREVCDLDQMAWIIFCIHANAQHHGLIKDFRNWPYSSYQKMLNRRPTLINIEWIWDSFGGKKNFLEFHELNRQSMDTMYWIID